ncbi:S41 family peptidase [Caulobacter segnis]|uniref:S41 family peptidase n=1 Tax=Caulobacter segnis TaxID=88688 RepID=UPI0024108B65|nr:S41 family peptidase [Caulobacter segnis]MDG2523409.1 S41 family peptidase [Caulobacter segnis]
MIKLLRLAVFGAAISFAAPAMAYDAAPWIEDLRQVKSFLTSNRYANLEWLTGEREANLDAVFERGEQQLTAATSEAEAKVQFERTLANLGDGHLEVKWSANRTALHAGDSGRPCGDMRKITPAQPVAARIAGWRPVDGPAAADFPAGIVESGGKKIGVVKISLFMADPTVCEAAAAKLNLPLDKPCDQACGDAVDRATYQLLTDRFGGRLRDLKAAGAEVLMIDIASNGGGREWAEVVARMVTAKPVKGARVGLVRAETTAQALEERAADLEGYARKAKGGDKTLLSKAADDLRTAAAEARRPCDSAPFLKREASACAWLVEGGYSTGLMDQLDPALANRPWAGDLYSPAKMKHETGLWSGPLIVLVDAGSASASEELAAELQDARAAVILGAPTFGAGCGHSTSAGPIPLKNSGGFLSLPDCARLRADGSNEIMGVEPDILIGFRRGDSAGRKAQRLAGKLPAAVAASLKSPPL